MQRPVKCQQVLLVRKKIKKLAVFGSAFRTDLLRLIRIPQYVPSYFLLRQELPFPKPAVI
jgi:hypothetical protein